MEVLTTALHPSVLAIICILLGGVGRDVVANLTGWPKARRDEYRTEIASLRAEVHALSEEVSRWRHDYYALLDAVVRGDRSEVTALLKEGM